MAEQAGFSKFAEEYIFRNNLASRGGELMEALAKAAAGWLIRYCDLPAGRQDLLAFGLMNLWLYLVDAAGLALSAWLSGVPALTLAAAFTAMIFRSATGGAHFESAWRCSVVSYGLSALLGASAAALAAAVGGRLVGALVLAAGVVAAWTIALYAPVESPAKPIRPKQRVRLRRWSWRLLAAWTVLQGVLLATGCAGGACASALGLLLQSMTLTPGGAKVSRWLDQLLSRMTTGLKEKEAC